MCPTVISFLGTDGAGSTEPGEDYIAQFPNENGNVKTRPVLPPDVCSKYFSFANIIDVHNQMRQGILKLEGYWRTTNHYLKLFETFLGITCTDCWKGVERRGTAYSETQMPDICASNASVPACPHCTNNARTSSPTIPANYEHGVRDGRMPGHTTRMNRIAQLDRLP